jgi:hypothetical protein
MSSNAKPVVTFDTCPVSVTIWENAPGTGPRYTVTATRSYKKDDEWQDSNNFTASELITLVERRGVASRRLREQARVRPE